MFTKHRARQLVLQKVMSRLKSCVLYDTIEEFESCYAFYYQNKKYVETGDINHMEIGHGPVLVTKEDGAIHFTGSAFDTGYYVRSLEGCGDPNGDPTSIIEIIDLPAPVKNSESELLLYLRENTSLGVVQIAKIPEVIASGRVFKIDVGTPEHAFSVHDDLLKLGAVVKHVWELPDGLDLSDDDEDVLDLDELLGNECSSCGKEGSCRIIGDKLAVLCDEPACLMKWDKQRDS